MLSLVGGYHFLISLPQKLPRAWNGHLIPPQASLRQEGGLLFNVPLLHISPVSTKWEPVCQRAQNIGILFEHHQVGLKTQPARQLP